MEQANGLNFVGGMLDLMRSLSSLDIIRDEVVHVEVNEIESIKFLISFVKLLFSLSLELFLVVEMHFSDLYKTTLS